MIATSKSPIADFYRIAEERELLNGGIVYKRRRPDFFNIHTIDTTGNYDLGVCASIREYCTRCFVKCKAFVNIGNGDKLMIISKRNAELVKHY